MESRRNIDELLRSQNFKADGSTAETAYRYAQCMATVENCIVVVSDLKENCSRIFHGRFSERLGVTGYSHENSIWETAILSKMDAAEQECKYLSEIRFFNFIRHIPIAHRRDYYLAGHLRFNAVGQEKVDVLHRMYYLGGEGGEITRYAICVYGPMSVALPARSVVVNSVTGDYMELSGEADKGILSKREKQILSLIETGLTSKAIADRLCISVHTVSRHRQEILSKLQVGNSTEAIRIARQLGIIGII